MTSELHWQWSRFFRAQATAKREESTLHYMQAELCILHDQPALGIKFEEMARRCHKEAGELLEEAREHIKRARETKLRKVEALAS